MVTAPHAITAEQHARERSVAVAIVLDVGMVFVYLTAAILAGSLTIAAELIRGVLIMGIEFFGLLIMRRIHRGRTAMFEFGSGRLEQIVNLAIAGGLRGGALWIGAGAVRRLTGDAEIGTPIGFALAAIAAGLNVYVNVLAWDGVRRAARSGGSLIMQGQLKARAVKLVSSACVLASMTVAALSTDGVVIVWADALGALIVCGFIVHAAIGMIYSDLPDLVDRAVNEDLQAAINRMLVKHFADYDRLDRVRTRRTGSTVHAEITLGFHRDLTMFDVDRRIDAMKISLRQEIDKADVAIVAVAC